MTKRDVKTPGQIPQGQPQAQVQTVAQVQAQTNEGLASSGAKLTEQEFKHFLQRQTAAADAANRGATVLMTAQAPLPIPQASAKPVSTQIWDEIKNVPLSMFALPPKPVHTYCKAFDDGGSTLYLDSSVPAFLAALETLVSSKYDVQLGSRFIEVTMKEPQANKKPYEPYPTRIKPV